ncbi:Flagellar assembly factor FliW [Syntrophomonas zehnderi OL-4]|uniref:Flagellar assembly factor FliW n=1 Tax=Syntrophomonas zehnderi OL-4 TaxID=690567 RepID=A0A0E4C7S9_9FIRM|nr:flagellar assembly protein FliW [Syntrophomonas zehnderi]CFX12509.1 Flagellar assembly factor FliW [Syntrophomonas zehnderi OL-4]
MRIQTALFGELNISPDDIIHFPDGLPGFETNQEFILLPLEENSPFFYLQSVREAELCLLLADPFSFFPGYQVDLSPAALQKLELPEENPPLIVLNIVTVPAEFKKATANLMAPVIINIEKKLGLQYIPEKTDYNTRHPLFPADKKTTGEGK